MLAGVNRAGIAEGSQKVPVEFGAGKNVVWKTPVAGRGYGSAIVMGSKIFLATADENLTWRDMAMPIYDIQ